MNIERYIKVNNNEATLKRVEYGYNPAHKFDFIWRTLVNNLNVITKEACLDISADETSWGHQG